MQTIIHSSDFRLTRALRRFIKQESKRTMNICSERVEKIIVRLKDLNGPKGGTDKECSVELRLRKRAPVIVSKRSSNTYKSIHRALERAARTARRKIVKRRDRSQRAETKPFEKLQPETLNTVTDQ